MGMFDSLYIECPNCKNEMEFQSKSGPCGLLCKYKDDLTTDIAIGMNGDIVKCKNCGKNIKLYCEIPLTVDVELEVVEQEAHY